VVVAQKDASQLNERLNEVSASPVADLQTATGDQNYYAWTDAAKRSEDQRKNMDGLQGGPGTVAGTALNLTTVQPDSYRGGTVIAGGMLVMNGGTVVTLGNGTATVSGEEAVSKAKEASTGLRQEQLAVDKSGAENLHRLQTSEGVTALPVGATQPAAGPEVRGLTVDNWAMAEAAAPATPANGPAAWGFAGKDQELKLAGKITSSQITKGFTRGYGGRMGRADLPADTDAETASESKNSLVALGDVRTASGQDGDNGAQPEAGRALKRERALEETEKTRRVTVLTTEGLDKSKVQDEEQTRARHATRERLAKTTIPNIEFKAANIQDVAQFISQTKSADGADAGVKVEVDPSVAEAPPITMTLKRVNALDTIRYVTDIAGLSYHIDGDKVVVTSRGADASRVVTRSFDVNSSLIESITGKTGTEQSAELQAFFTSAGMSFPQGASVAYDAKKQKLIVSNTPENIEKVESMTATLDAKPVSKPTEPMAKPVFRAAGANPWMAVEEQTFSTFSISVDSASFTLARRYLNGGQRPPPESVRTEEFVNFFEYAYAPPGRDLFSVHAQAARTPFCPPGVQLLKLGIKGRQMGRENRGANLTFLLDTSGSMNAPDRLDLARAALKLLVAKLGPSDRVALVTFSSRARLWLDFTPATDRQRILAALDGIQAAGFTHLEAGLKLAYETAARGFVSGASNRIILMSDGVANVGADATAELLAQVEQYRKQGIFCSVFGLGTGTYDDTMLQALASKGNGTYLFMDSLEEARRVFVDELAATLNKIAADVKIQVEFNPRRVKQYRQLGYEQRQLKTEDFRNDAVAAGEVGSGQSVTALYQVELQGDANEPIGTVRVRGRNLETGRVEELERAITAADFAPSFEQADARFRLAAAAAEFAEILRGSPYAAGAGCADVAKVLRPVALELSLDQKVQELLRLVNAATSAPQAAE
jgi:Ca-activated chloride channel family protein